MDKFDKGIVIVDALVVIAVLVWYVNTTPWGQQLSSADYDPGSSAVMITILAAIAHVARWMERDS